MPYVFYGTPYSKRATVRTWSGLSPIGVNAGTHIRGVLQSARGLAWGRLTLACELNAHGVLQSARGLAGVSWYLNAGTQARGVQQSARGLAWVEFALACSPNVGPILTVG